MPEGMSDADVAALATDSAAEEARQQQHDDTTQRVTTWDEPRIAALEARLGDTGPGPLEAMMEANRQMLERIDSLESKLDRAMTTPPVAAAEAVQAEADTPVVAEIPAEAPEAQAAPAKRGTRRFRIF